MNVPNNLFSTSFIAGLLAAILREFSRITGTAALTQPGFKGFSQMSFAYSLDACAWPLTMSDFYV
jgi:hypothetical protein